MLVDIFARRYESAQLRSSFEQRDLGMLVQAFRILAEDLYPYYYGGKEENKAVAFWTSLHSRLSRELGLQELSPQWFSYTTKWNGQDRQQTTKHTLVKVCENWMVAPVTTSPDEHLKDRLSLIEMGFRERENEINIMNSLPISVPFNRPAATLGNALAFAPVPDYAEQVRQAREEKTAAFGVSVDELNARFRQAKYQLHYHNGYIQASTDELIQSTVENPFWALVAVPPWKNVDLDMKTALDLRDSDGRDPAFYAARALESTIKVISDNKGWTTEKEKGAYNYIDNISSKTHALLDPWEGNVLKDFFSHVRNPFGHGPGHEKMPSLTRQQTEWAIEFSMSWIKSLIRRT